MPAPEHLELTWTGVFGTRTLPAEIWSMGLSATLGVQGPNRDLLEDNAALLAANWQSLQNVIGNNTHLTEFTVALVGSDGHIPRDLGGAYIQGKHTEGTLSGSGTTINLPLQCSLVISLRSIVSGPTGRGRFYMPSPQPTLVGADGRQGETSRDAAAAAARAFVNAVNVDLATMGQGVVAVASGGSASQGIAPAMNPIVLVGAGRVIDTQRRRRGDLDEEMEWLTIP